MGVQSGLPACDVAVVGGGIIGLAVAEALAARGRQVTVLERGALARAASWAGGGILSPLPPGATDPPLQALLDDSLERYPDWCERLRQRTGIDPEYWVCGARYFSADRVEELPWLAQVRNPRLCRALAAAALAQGVRILEHTPVLGLLQTGARVTGLQTALGDLACTQIVLAAGAWSARWGGAHVVPVKGQMLQLRTMPGQLPCMLIGESVYLVPRRDGTLLVGSTLERTGFETQTTEAAREELLDAAARLYPGIRSLPLERQWAGLRPESGSGLPLIGPDPQREGLYHCTGHFRIGITLAPGSAQLLAALVCGESLRLDPGPFLPR